MPLCFSLSLFASLNLPLISFYLFLQVNNVYYCSRHDHHIDKELKATISNSRVVMEATQEDGLYWRCSLHNTTQKVEGKKQKRKKKL